MTGDEEKRVLRQALAKWDAIDMADHHASGPARAAFEELAARRGIDAKAVLRAIDTWRELDRQLAIPLLRRAAILALAPRGESS